MVFVLFEHAFKMSDAVCQSELASADRCSTETVVSMLAIKNELFADTTKYALSLEGT